MILLKWNEFPKQGADATRRLLGRSRSASSPTTTIVVLFCVVCVSIIIVSSTGHYYFDCEQTNPWDLPHRDGDDDAIMMMMMHQLLIVVVEDAFRRRALELGPESVVGVDPCEVSIPQVAPVLANTTSPPHYRWVVLVDSPKRAVDCNRQF
jgi:hypothetical protein